MMNLGRIALACGLLLAASANSRAGTIPIADLYNTGVDAAHNALGTGQIDGNYSLTVSASGATDPIVYRNNAWVANAPVLGAALSAQWIAPSSATVIDGFYTYTTSFTLGADAILSSVEIGGRFTADDKITDVYLNGQALGITTGAGDEVYGQWFNFSIANSAYFLAGTTNYLAFETKNTHGSVNGLIVQMTGSYNAVPEPASVAMMGMGGLAALAFGRRKLRTFA